MSRHGRFEAGVRAWLEGPEKGSHPLREYWIRDHLDRVPMVRRFFLPLVEEFRSLRGARLLDVGCGTGGAAVAAALAGARAVGLDLSGHMLSLAGLRAEEDGVRLALVQGDACRLPFRDNDFDLCLSTVVIEHVPDPSALLREMHRVLRPGGLVVLSAPHRLRLREPHTDLLGLSWLPHAWAGGYAAWRGRRAPGEAWDVWLDSPWRLRRRIAEAGFAELRSPWVQPRRLGAERTGAGAALARIGGLVRLVRWGYRWRAFLEGNLTFVLRKPGAGDGPGEGGDG